MKTLLCVLIVVGVVVGLGGTVTAAVLAQDTAPECRMKGDAFLFGGASFLLPGLGQFFAGEDGKALMHIAIALGLPIAVYVVAISISRVSPELAAVLIVTSPLAYLGWSVVSAMDAYNTSKAYCQA